MAVLRVDSGGRKRRGLAPEHGAHLGFCLFAGGTGCDILWPDPAAVIRQHVHCHLVGPHHAPQLPLDKVKLVLQDKRRGAEPRHLAQLVVDGIPPSASAGLHRPRVRGPPPVPAVHRVDRIDIAEQRGAARLERQVCKLVDRSYDKAGAPVVHLLVVRKGRDGNRGGIPPLRAYLKRPWDQRALHALLPLKPLRFVQLAVRVGAEYGKVMGSFQAWRTKKKVARHRGPRGFQRIAVRIKAPPDGLFPPLVDVLPSQGPVFCCGGRFPWSCDSSGAR